MALSALEVLAVFKVEDLATNTFRKIAAEAKALSRELKEIAAGIDQNFGAAFLSMQGGITHQIEEARLLAGEWRAVERAALAAGRAAHGGASRNLLGGGSGGRGGGHGRGSVPSFSAGVPVPGGHLHSHGSGAGALVGATAAGYSVWEALEINDIASRGIANVFPDGLPSDTAAKQKQLIDIIKREAGITKLPLGTVAKMALDEIKTNANMPWDQRLVMLPQVIESAAREAYVKDTDPLEATKAFVGQLHQARAFSPEEVAKYGPMLAFFASKDPNALTNIAKSSAYHTPIGTAMMGIPIEQDLAAQTVLDRTGVGGKSGTWLREMVVRAAKPIKNRHYNEAINALRAFGLMDKDDHPTWMTDGHYDESKLLHILNKSLKSVPIEERANRLRDVFGERGAGAVALMTEDKMLEQYDDVLAEAQRVKANADFWNQINATNPAQQMKGAMVDAQIAALNAGNVLTPPAIGAAKAASGITGWAAGLLPAPDSAAQKRGEMMGAGAGVGAVIGGGIGVLGGPVGVLGGAVLGGAIGADAGYLAGTFTTLDSAARGAADALKFLWKYGPGSGGRDDALSPRRMNFISPDSHGTKPIFVTAELLVDGEKLAQTSMTKLADMAENTISASANNGGAYADQNGANPIG
jgi:hypothetical protein